MLPKSIWNTNNALQVNFLPEEKILHFQKKLWALFGRMKIIKKKSKSKLVSHGWSAGFDFFYIWFNFFLEIADRLVFCMFDIKLLIFTQSQDILLIFSQRQKTALARSNKIHSEVRNLTALNLVSFRVKESQ